MKLLALDTATEALSVALWHDGEVRSRFEVIGRGHAERVLPWVDGLLAEAGWRLGELDAIAFGRGPGAFTGVRIAISTAQGLAFACDRPVVPVSDLAAVAWRLFERAPAAGCALACLDARMGEVYAGLATRRGDGGIELLEERLLQPAAVAGLTLPGGAGLVAGGHGFAAYPDLGASFGSRLLHVEADCLPHAEPIARLAALEVAAGRVVDPVAAEPVYLRDDVATKSGPRPVA